MDFSQIDWKNWREWVDEPDVAVVVALVMLVNGLFSFLSLFFISAPYGRFSSSASKGWGPKVNAKVAWMVMESPSAIVFTICWIRAYLDNSASTNNLSSKILCFMFLLHYINRAFIYPLRTRGGNPMPLSVMLMAWIFCISNGFLQGQTVSRFLPAQLWEKNVSTLMNVLDLNDLGALPVDQLSDLLRFFSGVLLFFIGFGINVHSDSILISLRDPVNPSYKIPFGGMFKYVSGANYFGEMVEWLGFAVACGVEGPRSSVEPLKTFSVFFWPALVFAIFTFCNLAPRARSYHQWYLSKFKEDYPRDRRAIIPFLW